MIREIPIIDFSGFDSDNKKLRNSVAKKVHEAASKVGFMYVKNININEQVIKEAFNSSANFFSLPDKKKREIQYLEKTNHGYQSIESIIFQTIIMISMNTIKTITGAKKYCILLF